MSANPVVDPSSLSEPRLARIESDVEHIREDLRDIKLDLRTANARIDVCARHADLVITNQNLKDLGVKVDRQLIYLIGSQAAMLAALLTVMAKGFHWL